MAKMTLTIGSYPIISPAMKNVTPRKIATADTILMNLSISMANVVFELLADWARLAIFPITVLSPVKITMPTPVPSVQLVPKNAKFSVSNGFSSVQLGVLRSS